MKLFIDSIHGSYLIINDCLTVDAGLSGAIVPFLSAVFIVILFCIYLQVAYLTLRYIVAMAIKGIYRMKAKREREELLEKRALLRSLAKEVPNKNVIIYPVRK